MSIEFSCGECGKQYAVADGMAGVRAKCKACGSTMTVPRPFGAKRATGQPTMLCPGCGRVLPDTASYCRECGFDFKGGPLYAAPPPPSPAPRRPAAGVQTWHLVAGGIALGVIVIAAVVGLLMHSGGTPSANGAAPSANGPVHNGGGTGSTPAPPPPSHPLFSARQSPSRLADGIDFYPVVIGGDGPGLPMQVYLYLPTGQREHHSLPCVFIAPAGSRLFHGMPLGNGDTPEHLPYVRAGFAVCAYELSGSLPEATGGTVRWSNVKGPLREYMAAAGGVTNARLAIDYVLAQVPEVNPQHLYAAGHSSAATVALDVGVADNRIRGVAAYAPACDVVQRLASATPALEQLVPGAGAFVSRISPMEHVNEFACPIFLFHADDDGNVPTSDNQAFADALRAARKQIQFVRVPSGGHYDSMIDDGIPRGIEFFKSLGASPLPALEPAR